MTETTMDKKEVARDRKDHKDVRNTADLRGQGKLAKTWPAKMGATRKRQKKTAKTIGAREPQAREGRERGRRGGDAN